MLTAMENFNDVLCVYYKTFDISPQPSLLLTSAGEHDVVDSAIQSADPLHCYLGVVDVLGDEAGPVAKGLDGVLQQWVVLDKLKGLVWQVERVADVLLPHVIVDALQRIKKKAKKSEKLLYIFFSLRLFKLDCSSRLQLRAAGKELHHCSGPIWCVTAPQWPSACTCPWRRLLPQPLGCRHILPTSPRCPCRVTINRKADLIFHLPSDLMCDTDKKKKEKQHRPLRGKDPVDDCVPPICTLQDEDVVHHVKDKVELWHGANQLGFQKGRPLLLQRALTAQVTLRG